MSFGISVNDLPEQSTIVPSQEQFDGHGTSEKQSFGLDFMSSKPVHKIIIGKFIVILQNENLLALQ